MTKEELEKLQALSEPQPVPGSGEEQTRWDEQVRTAMDARRMAWVRSFAGVNPRVSDLWWEGSDGIAHPTVSG